MSRILPSTTKSPNCFSVFVISDPVYASAFNLVVEPVTYASLPLNFPPERSVATSVTVAVFFSPVTLYCFGAGAIVTV